VNDSDLIDRLYDDDLDEEQAQHARQLLSADPRAAARLERVALIGSLIREIEDERRLPSDFTDRVMERVAPERDVRRVSKLYPAFAAGASALALAAAAVLWIGGQGAPAIPSSVATALGVPSTAAPSQAGAEPLAADGLTEPPAVSIESVDFGATQGAIFLVSAGVTDTMVVWTLDEPNPTGPRR
jgi:anti-sigma factor RsiW